MRLPSSYHSLWQSFWSEFDEQPRVQGSRGASRPRPELDRITERVAPTSIHPTPDISSFALVAASTAVDYSTYFPAPTSVVAPPPEAETASLPPNIPYAPLVEAVASLDTGSYALPTGAEEACSAVAESIFPNPLAEPAPMPQPTPLAPSPGSAIDATNTQAGNAGGSVSLMTSTTQAMPTPPPAPIPPMPPPIVPPPTTLPMPPVANADAYTVCGGTLAVSASSGLLANDFSPTGQPMTVMLVGQARFGSVALAADGSFAYTVAPGLNVTDSFAYQVSAGGLISNVATVTLTDIGTAPAVLPPTLANPGGQTSNTGVPVSLQLVGSSPEGNPLAYSVVGLPSGLAVDSSTGLISGSIYHSAALTNAVTATVTDTVTGLTGSQGFNWAVTPSTHPPTLDPIPDWVNSAGDAVYLPVNGNDVDGNPLTYTATGLPGGIATDPATGNITGTIATNAYRTTPYQVTVTVSDGTLGARHKERRR